MPGAYAASPLQQIAGLASLFASTTGGKSGAQGFKTFISDILKSGGGGGGGGGGGSNSSGGSGGTSGGGSYGDTSNTDIINTDIGGGYTLDSSGNIIGPDGSVVDFGEV
jgi:hypothetical protein